MPRSALHRRPVDTIAKGKLRLGDIRGLSNLMQREVEFYILRIHVVIQTIRGNFTNL